MGCGASKSATRAAPDDQQAPAKETAAQGLSEDAAAAKLQAIQRGNKVRAQKHGGGATAPTAEGDRSATLGKLFDFCDDDGDGVMTLEEFTQLFDSKVIDKTMRKEFDDMDIDKSKGLSKDEFIAAQLRKFEGDDDELFNMVMETLMAQAEKEVVGGLGPELPAAA